MKSVVLPLAAALVVAAGCSSDDQGVVMGCFGLVNENVPGQDVFSTDVVTNMFFGGCSPDDSGMQIMERATLTAAQDQSALALKCDNDCNARLGSYIQVHPDANLPLKCQTLFASQCDNLEADVNGIGASGLAFQAGGPADTRFALTGRVDLTVGTTTTSVPAKGVVDALMPTCANGTTCAFTFSRFDFVATDVPFTFNGMQVDSAQVQNQGLINGSRNAGNTVINANAIEAEVSAMVGGQVTSSHVRNPQAINRNGSNLTLTQFLTGLDVTLTGTSLKVRLVVTGVTAAGSPPVAAITPQQTSYECQCRACTTASFTSAASDVDNDLQALSWKLNGVPQTGDGTSAPQTLDLQLGLGKYTLELIATDSRGAAAGTSLPFSVVDTTPPSLSPPFDVTLRSCDFPDIGRATATDTCSDTVVITNNSPGNFNVGTTTVTWTAEDPSGNQSTANQRVTVTNVTNFQTCCPAGYNVIVVQQSNQTTNGTAGNDCIIGTDGDDTINGGAGNDIIFGRGGQDHISGGDGDDIIMAGEGVNTVDGGNGNDKILGGGGTDTITGGAGNDLIIGGGGDDTINGNDGDDVIYGNQGQDHLTGGPGNDFIDGGSGDDQITTGTTPAATGNAGDDVLVGGIDNDTIIDNFGNNALEGFAGDDHLTGGPGFDTLLGGAGHDTCAGGGGTDTFALCND